MQPLAYFAARALLGWLQFVEKEGRAFLSNALILVATGAAHCWAVVYALFIAIHTRAMRFDGYHEGYTEHLPFFVSWTETLSVASIGVWWAASFAMVAIRIVDDDSKGLPVDAGDVNVGSLFKLLRSQKLQDILATAQTVSCIGLFASIILLCIAMASMAGGITACEVCLCFVAIGFALPHAVLACHRINTLNPKKNEDSRVAVRVPAVEAAAQEAAALGPQLAVFWPLQTHLVMHICGRTAYTWWLQWLMLRQLLHAVNHHPKLVLWRCHLRPLSSSPVLLLMQQLPLLWCSVSHT